MAVVQLFINIYYGYYILMVSRKFKYFRIFFLLIFYTWDIFSYIEAMHILFHVHIYFFLWYLYLLYLLQSLQVCKILWEMSLTHTLTIGCSSCHHFDIRTIPVDVQCHMSEIASISNMCVWHKICCETTIGLFW